MLATGHTLDPEALYTINAAGFSATADAFARDPHSQGLWFLSMVPDGAQGDLGLPAQATARRRPPHPGRGWDGPLGTV